MNRAPYGYKAVMPGRAKRDPGISFNE
jgi:hypothetical protein